MTEKIAVVVIHGIGEQRPMETLRGFVRGVLGGDKTDDPPKYFSRPDRISKSLELRLLRTRDGSTDFYELYWAQLIKETTYGHVFGWLRRLFFRLPGTVPPHLRPIYNGTWATVLVTMAILALTQGLALPSWGDFVARGSLLSVGLAALANLVLLGFVGDAARYLSTVPSSIELRRAIREAGIELLNGLHDAKYSRIVVVGHSLGSVIAYDLIRQLWAERGAYYDRPSDSEQPKLAAVEAAGAVLEGKHASEQVSAAERDAFVTAQHELFLEDQELKSRWRISDLITLGSPLAHAAVLLADDLDELRVKQRERELPTCPPVREHVKLKDGTFASRYCYWFWHNASPPPGQPLLYQLHHAAPFSQVRWTNIYHPAFLGILGDPVGGPLARYFGPGIQDVELPRKSIWDWTPLAHTSYWRPSSNGLRELTKALAMPNAGPSPEGKDT